MLLLSKFLLMKVVQLYLVKRPLASIIHLTTEKADSTWEAEPNKAHSRLWRCGQLSPTQFVLWTVTREVSKAAPEPASPRDLPSDVLFYMDHSFMFYYINATNIYYINTTGSKDSSFRFGTMLILSLTPSATMHYFCRDTLNVTIESDETTQYLM